MDESTEVLKLKRLLARARQARDPVRVAELEKELIDLSRVPAAEWECISCDHTFPNEKEAEKGNKKCPNCGDVDKVRPTISSSLPYDQRPGKGPVVPPPPKPKPKPKVAVRLSGPNACPCGCGLVPEGVGVFYPGHDGRVAGWIRRMEKGELKRNQVNRETYLIWYQWIEDGKPGGVEHPKLKDSTIKVLNRIRKEKRK